MSAPDDREPGDLVLRLSGITKRFGGLTANDAIDLTLRRGEILALLGENGAGKTTLMNILFGHYLADAGTVEVAGADGVLQPLRGEAVALGSPAGMVAAGIGRIPEDRLHDGVVGDMAVWENLALEDYRRPAFSNSGFLRGAAARAHARRAIEGFDVRCPGPEAAARLLSGGNVQKLILARVLTREPDVILANQPSRGLDIGAVTDVHRRLLEARARGARVILISEDLDELLALADRVAVLYRGRLSPAMATEDVTIRELGLMMAGHDGEAEANDAA